MEALIGLLILVGLLFGGFFLISFVLFGIATLWSFISNKSKKPTFEDKYNAWYRKQYLEFYNHDEYIREKRLKEAKNKAKK